MPDVELYKTMQNRLLRNLLIGCPLAAILTLPASEATTKQTFQYSIPEGVTLSDTTCKLPVIPFHLIIKPLADLIARGEGDYDAVNRGYAGDTPGGIKRLTGSSFAGFTVSEVIGMQRRWLYAVGRYQFIPVTLRFAVAHSDVDLSDKFTQETQDKLFAALVLYKRPSIGAYIRGDHNLIGWALDDLAREWASVEYRYGRGYYDHIGGNRASITRGEAISALNTSRNNLTDS